MSFIKVDTSIIFKKSRKNIADKFIEVVNDFEDYWPLTIRQIFYQLVAKQVIPNKHSEYQKISKIGTILREHDLISWSAIQDKTRRTTAKRGRADVSGYIKSEFKCFLVPYGYSRCYVQDQKVYCEVSTEKEALADVMEDVVYNFCTRLNVVRGQVSATMVEKIASRMDRAVMRGQEPVILHCGDFDPTGIQIPRALQKNLYNRHGIDCQIKMIALTPQQIKENNLPPSIDGLKPKDPNLKNWLQEQGDQKPVELDSLHPEIIKQILRDELMKCYDMEDFERQKAKESEERETLQKIRDDIQHLFKEKYPDYC